MSRRNRYPRIGTKDRVRTDKTCAARDCGAPATQLVRVQFGPFRGSDDSFVHVCDADARVPGGDVRAWIQRFPPEAWSD